MSTPECAQQKTEKIKCAIKKTTCLEPLAVQLGINKHDIVTAMVIATMDKNGVQRVLGGRCLRLLQKLRQIHILIELVAVVDLDVAIGLRVVLEPHQMQMKHGRKRLEEDALLRDS